MIVDSQNVPLSRHTGRSCHQRPEYSSGHEIYRRLLSIVCIFPAVVSALERAKNAPHRLIFPETECLNCRDPTGNVLPCLFKEKTECSENIVDILKCQKTLDCPRKMAASLATDAGYGTRDRIGWAVSHLQFDWQVASWQLLLLFKRTRLQIGNKKRFPR